MHGTVDLLRSIASFLKLHEPLWRSSAVEFFTDRLWEQVDARWLEDLQSASIQELLLLPSGFVQDAWCNSLKDFIKTAESLSLQRQPDVIFEKAFPGFSRCNIRRVLSQGMNPKKQHEVEVLSAVVASMFGKVDASHVVDVGAGQGYLAQVLAYEYGLPVVALDACAHHGDVTNARSQRIKKHYMARARKANLEASQIVGPETVTYHVNDGDCNSDLPYFLSTLALDKFAHQANVQNVQSQSVEAANGVNSDGLRPCSFFLTGLHVCGDLSASMLRAYLTCDQVIGIAMVGCCYNLLTEYEHHAAGFPLSKAAKEIGLALGRRACDLACQSADRWRDIGPDSAMLNFEQLSFRAAFQVLHKYHPQLAGMHVSLGRLGKTRCRNLIKREKLLAKSLSDSVEAKRFSATRTFHYKNFNQDKFIQFSNDALARLNLEAIPEVFLSQALKEICPQSKLFGAFWSLRAVLGPVLETYILLDRLIFLQEHIRQEELVSSLKQYFEPRLIAIFDPELSPRNMAIIAMKNSSG